MPANGRWDLIQRLNGYRILLTWRIWWAPNNASKWQMGFNSVFKGLINPGFSWLWLCIFYQLYYILKLPSGSVYTVLSLKLLISVENDIVFFRDSAHPKRYRNLANSATTNDKIRVSKGYPRSHSKHGRSLVFTTVKTLAWLHAHTCTCAHIKGVLHNHPHTPTNAHNVCKITGHFFYIYKLCAFVGYVGDYTCNTWNK
jgi:hypothetical protein